MLTKLRKPISALVLSLAVALTGMTAPTAPAHADDDTARVLAGLAALFILGAAIEANSGDSPRVVHTPPPRNLRVAPARCFRDFGPVRGYLVRCTRNNVPRPALLPDRCIVRVQTQQGPRNLYVGRCLARNGWVREAGFHP
ncbi:MAG: hypothetical protein AAF914_04585 [Pseudomonadota bacterium]